MGEAQPTREQIYAAGQTLLRYAEAVANLKGTYSMLTTQQELDKQRTQLLKHIKDLGLNTVIAAATNFNDSEIGAVSRTASARVEEMRDGPMFAMGYDMDVRAEFTRRNAQGVQEPDEEARRSFFYAFEQGLLSFKQGIPFDTLPQNGTRPANDGMDFPERKQTVAYLFLLSTGIVPLTADRASFFINQGVRIAQRRQELLTGRRTDPTRRVNLAQ